MRREFIGGPLDGEVIPLDDEDLTDEIHIDMIGLNKEISVHVYAEDEESGNYKYEGEYSPDDLYEEEEEDE
jgi:hypothetical protein